MNFLKNRRIRRKIHNAFVKILVFINLFSLMFWMCAIDSIISWQPYVIMAVNFGFLMLVAYVNGWIYDTEPCYEREDKEND